jgi:hypothetical protein
MKTCPNCGEEFEDNFRYCDGCGSVLDGFRTGDFKTDFKNVFHDGGFYYYLSREGSRQVVIVADNLDNLKWKVDFCKLPWEKTEVRKEAEDDSPNFLNPKVSLVEHYPQKFEEYGIIGAKELGRNPAYKNLDKFFK